MTDGSDIWGPSVEMAQGLDLNLIFAEQVISTDKLSHHNAAK